MEERLELLAIAERHRAWIIEDDYDGEYRFRGRPVPALRGISGSDRVIYVGSFGKTMFSALRIGFLVVPRVPGLAGTGCQCPSGDFTSPLLSGL